MTILTEIFEHKRAEVEAQKQRVSFAELFQQVEAAKPPLDFAGALRRNHHAALIAEVKKGSPSKGVMVENFEPLELARLYAANGASAISVLTDEKYFGGSLEYLREIAGLNLGVPLLRKEFICDPYQIYEARAAGADAVLLIVAELTDHQLRIFQSLIRKLGMAALVEVHTRSELSRAVNVGAGIVGINNRNLHDFSVSLDTTRTLRPLLSPEIIVVAESGIRSGEDVEGLNVDAVLVGEAIVRSEDMAAKVRELAGIKRGEAIVPVGDY